MPCVYYSKDEIDQLLAEIQGSIKSLWKDVNAQHVASADQADEMIVLKNSIRLNADQLEKLQKKVDELDTKQARKDLSPVQRRVK